VAGPGPGVADALRGLLRGPDFDVVLALAAFAALLIDPLASHQVKDLSPLAAGLALVTAWPLVLRRRYPLGVLLAIVPLLLVCLAVFHPDHAAAGIVMLVVFTVGLHGHRVRALVVGALMAPVVAAGVLITSTKGDSPATTVAYVALVLGALVAVRTVARGDALLDPGATRRLIEAFVQQQHADPAPPARLALPDSLTSRELEILGLIAGGLTNREIAARLFISPLTCKSHVSRILAKLDARDRTQLVVIAYESGLVVPGQPRPPGVLPAD
jgi:DNA-binding CsgD family transcriptional regulator